MFHDGGGLDIPQDVIDAAVKLRRFIDSHPPERRICILGLGIVENTQPFMRICNRCGKVIHSSQPMLADVIYCSYECAD